MLKGMGNILYLELLLRYRNLNTCLYPTLFFIIVLTLFPIAFTPDKNFLNLYCAGCVWIAALLASLLSIESIFIMDLEDGHLEQLILSTHSFNFIVMMKIFIHWLTTIFPIIILSPLIAIIFQISFSQLSILIATLLLGTPIFTLLAATSTALTAGLRQTGMLIGLLTFPLLIPVLIFGIIIYQEHTAGFPIAGPIAFLAAISLLSATILPIAIATILKLGIE